MDILNEVGIQHIMGGGHWVQLPNGKLVYVEDDEEEDDDDVEVIIFG